MPWYIILIIVLGSICGIGILSALYQLLISIEKYFKTKSDLNVKSEEIKSLKLLKEQREPIDVSRKVTATSNMINIISFIIDVEVTSFLYQYAKLNKPYPVAKADDDLLVILERIQQVFKHEIFTYDEVIFNEEYIMLFITRQTTIKWLESILKFNGSLEP